MHPVEVYPNLFIGNDESYLRERPIKGWSFLRPVKYGPGGHKDLLGYKTPGAPKGPNYLSVRQGNLLALNLLDIDDPHFIPDEAVDEGLQFIQERLQAGDKVLVACNAGESRAPSIAFLYLRSIGEVSPNLVKGLKEFRHLYPKYDPGMGWKQYVKTKYSSMKSIASIK